MHLRQGIKKVDLQAHFIFHTLFNSHTVSQKPIKIKGFLDVGSESLLDRSKACKTRLAFLKPHKACLREILSRDGRSRDAFFYISVLMQSKKTISSVNAEMNLYRRIFQVMIVKYSQFFFYI